MIDKGIFVTYINWINEAFCLLIKQYIYIQLFSKKVFLATHIN